jgi:hypothetical protein
MAAPDAFGSPVLRDVMLLLRAYHEDAVIPQRGDGAATQRLARRGLVNIRPDGSFVITAFGRRTIERRFVRVLQGINPYR